MEIEISFKNRSGSFYIETFKNEKLYDIDDPLLEPPELTFITCPLDKTNAEKSVRSLTLKNQIHPALKAFLEIESGDTDHETSDIISFCNTYGLLLDVGSYAKMLSASIDYMQFADSYMQRLYPGKSSDTISMPLCLFKFYKKLFDNICELHETIERLKQSPSQKNSLMELLLRSYFNLLMQPYFLTLPEPYNHHFKKAHPLARFAVHYATYIKKHCLDNEHLAPDTFWEVTKEAFRLNTGYKKIASRSGQGILLLEKFSATEFILRLNLETFIPYCENNLLDTISISKIFAQDLISDEYTDIFAVIIPTLMKYGCLKIEPDYSINLCINNKKGVNFDKLIHTVVKSGTLLIQQILSSYTQGLLLQSEKDIDLNNIMVLNVENLLQFLAINLLDTFSHSRIRKCIHKKCNRYVLSSDNKRTIANQCCRKHYDAQQKYMKRHNLRIEDLPW